MLEWIIAAVMTILSVLYLIPRIYLPYADILRKRNQKKRAKEDWMHRENPRPGVYRISTSKSGEDVYAKINGSRISVRRGIINAIRD